MASAANVGQRIPDNETRNALIVLAAEVTALSGHVGAAVLTLAIATDTLTAVITNIDSLKKSLIAAGLLLP